MFLGLDLGTTNVKAVVIDEDGRVVAQGSVPLRRYTAPDGSVEQDIDEIWEAACTAIRRAITEQGSAQIDALGISSQGGALQLLDADDKPIARVISWLDGRGRPFDEQLVLEIGEDYLVEHIGCNLSTMTLGQWLRLRQETPELLAASKHVGFVGDVIVGRLCGRRAHDATSLSIGMLYNPSLGRADPDLLARLGLREDQLPDLVPAVTPAGMLQAEAARATGLPAGIPVSPAVHDQYAASLGAGSVRAGDVCLGTGTAWVLVANTAELTRPAMQNTFVCPHPVNGLYGQLLSMANGGSAVDWALNLLGDDRPSPEKLDDLLEAVPPGSEGLHFWPLLLPGRKAAQSIEPGGRMTGITLAHSSGHLLRAVVEGLACELARHLTFLTDAGLPVQRLVMCGGAAASRVTPQIVADVADRPVTRINEPAVSAFGAAVIARALTQAESDLGDLAFRLAPAGRTIQPGDQVPTYQKLLQKYLEPFPSNAIE